MSGAGAISDGSNVRLRARVEGVVQGVGFRPHVYRLARALDLSGHVLNDERGVLLEVEGSAGSVERFLERLVSEAPPLARIERILPQTIPLRRAAGFEIRPSLHAGTAQALVSPDTATCADCLRELNDPRDRRYRYPFINCTNCGPRFTIATGVPYDRALTTMASFVMCERCRAEYEDPSDRRFHAQPNACPVCGPRVRLVWTDRAFYDGKLSARTSCDGEPSSARASQRAGDRAGGDAQDAVRAAADALRAGLIVAVKGIGGYHLACRADSQRAVSALRERKHREDRPFALMVADLAAAQQLVWLDADTSAILQDRARPIVIARRRAHARVAGAVAPRCPELGVMLPYTPLHHLLLADFAQAVSEADVAAIQSPNGELDTGGRAPGDAAVALVMTSGNLSDEPIAYADEDAIARLAPIADALLLHDRPIHMRTDDSVLRATSTGRPLLLRRSRGYVPSSIELPLPALRPVLACGAELKSTFCVARGARAWVSHHIGDLKNYETLRSFGEGVEHFQRLFALTPEVIAHDLHPDYLSSAYAIERAATQTAAGQTAAAQAAAVQAVPTQTAAAQTGDRSDPGHGGAALVGVQHHHAHLAACLAEHGELGRVVGAVFDGSGYGTDGTVWGGELLVGDLRDFERVGHLRTVRLPGGDRAVREPWRMACAWLAEAQPAGQAPPLPRTLRDCVSAERWETIARLAHSDLAPLTSSVGRLFDAVAALCGVCANATYEGQAAIELEGAVDHSERGAYEIALERRDGMLELDPRAAVSAVARDRTAGLALGIVASRFHRGLALATARVCGRIAGERGLDAVVLSGGVFQNRVLLELTVAELQLAGLRALVPRRLPPGDGAISYGQAAVAAARLS